MNIFASSNFRLGNIAAVQQNITARVITAVTEGSNDVLHLSQDRVPIKTGDLYSSGHIVVTVEQQTVTGEIIYDAPYAIYPEMGIGRLGASGEWSGPYEYSDNINGFAGVGYLRSSLDDSQSDILQKYRDQGFGV